MMKTSFLFLIVSTIISFGGMSLLKGQEIKPDLYWNFNESPVGKPVIGESVLKGKAFKVQSQNGIFGSYLHFDEESTEIIGTRVAIDDAVTIECWLRFSSEDFRQNTRLFWFRDNRLAINFANEKLVFNSSVIGPKGKRMIDYFSIDLNRNGRTSLGYYLDNQWHHFVFKYDGKNGRKEVWVDGVSPEGFSQSSGPKGKICGTGGCNQALSFGYKDDGIRNMMGDLDELMIYYSIIPEKLHIKHYLEGKKGVQKPTFSNFSKVGEVKEQQLAKTIDLKEYAPGHPNVSMSQIDQLRQFPTPRYFSGHKLLPLFNWMGMDYFAGVKLPGVTRVQAVRNSVEIQKELAQRWNYMVVLQNANLAQHDENLRDKNKYLKAWIDLANQHPEFPLGISTFWAQLNPRAINIPQSRPEVLRRDLNPKYYFRDASGKFLDPNGKNTTRSYISLAASDDFCYRDGMIQKHNITRILSKLTRPVNMISENGEVEPLPVSEKLIEKDPSIARDMKRLGMTDWDLYQSHHKTRQRQKYLSAFSSDKKLKNTIFSWYAVDGGPETLNRFTWSKAREVGSKINGQYYATADFYPRWPNNWADWKGAWRGWKWMEVSRAREILAGDRLASPFVAAGWNADPERNVRPSQWLGLLKHLGVVGSEFFYTGFFNVGSGNRDFPDPRDYTWQSVMPAYAQAITSRYEEILRSGNVLMDDKGQPIIRYPAGDPRLLITVRKHDQKPVYIIAANINPVSNLKGNVEDEKEVSIKLANKRISFKARRQGNVYVLDLTNQNTPIFYQLDTWHEAGHPLKWSKNLLFEAEVFDESKKISVVTEGNSSNKYDFTNFSSYVKPTRVKGCVAFHFSLSQAQIGIGDIELLARSSSGKKAEASIYLDDKLIGKLNCANRNSWRWISRSSNGKSVSLNIKDRETHKLEIRFDDLDMELNQVRIKME